MKENIALRVIFSVLAVLVFDARAMAASAQLQQAEQKEKEGIANYYEEIKRRGNLSPEEAQKLRETYVEKPMSETQKTFLKEEENKRQVEYTAAKAAAEAEVSELSRKNAGALAKAKTMKKEELAKLKPVSSDAKASPAQPSPKTDKNGSKAKKTQPEKDFDVDSSPPIDSSGIATELEFEGPKKK